MPHHRPAPRRSDAVRHRLAAVVVAAAVAVGVVSLSTPARADGTVYFVSPTGLDTNSGTSAATPFKTIQRALNLAQPGTTITLAAGTYRENLSTKVSGSAGAPITIRGPETGKEPAGRFQAVLTPVATATAASPRAITVNHSYYTFDGFTIEGQSNVDRSTYPTSVDQIRGWKDSLAGKAVNSRLIYVGDTASDLTGITVSNMFLDGAGGECVRFRNRTSNSLVVGSVVQYCGLYPSGDDSTKYKYHNGEGVYIGTSPKSTTEPFAANDTTNNIVVRDSTVHTFGAECFEVKENANHNRLENGDCGFNDEPLSWKGSNIELRGDHNTVMSSTVAQSHSWNVKMSSDAPSYDLGGNTLQKSRFGGFTGAALRYDQTGPGSSFCADTFDGAPVSQGTSASTMGDPTAACADTTPPTAPTGLAAAANSPTEVGLTWAPATDDVGVTGYVVLRDGLQLAPVTGTSYTDSGLTPGTGYTYTVVARDAANNRSPLSDPASVTTPLPPPTALAATATSSTAVSLSWTAPAGAQVASYDVLRGGAAVGTTTTTSYTDAGLAAGTGYTYAVVAHDAAGHVSPASDAASVTTLAAPAAPTSVTATLSSPTAATVSWTAPAGAQVGSYDVLRDGTRVVTTTGTSYVDAGLTAGTPYSYTVVARDTGGTPSPASQPAAVTTPPSAPTALTATATSPTTVSLSWTAPANGKVTQYGVLRDGVQVATPTATSFTDNGLTAGVSYTYTVVARDSVGGTSPTSNPSSVTTPTPPPAPTRLTATATSPTSVSLAWTAPANVTIASYDVLRDGTRIASPTGTTFVDNGVTAGKGYTYTVVARDTAGLTSTPSDPATVTTPTPPTTTTPTTTTTTTTTTTGPPTSTTTVRPTTTTPAPPTTTTPVPPTTTTPVTTPPVTTTPTTTPPTTTPPVTTTPTTTTSVPPIITPTTTTPPPTAKTIVVEAETGVVTAPMAVRADAAAQGGKYVSQTSGTTIGKDTITVTVPTTGHYALALRVISPNSTSDSFSYAVDKSNTAVWNLGTHTTWAWVTGPTLTLSAGSHKIIISNRENGARLDAVRLTPVP